MKPNWPRNVQGGPTARQKGRGLDPGLSWNSNWERRPLFRLGIFEKKPNSPRNANAAKFWFSEAQSQKGKKIRLLGPQILVLTCSTRPKLLFER